MSSLQAKTVDGPEIYDDDLFGEPILTGDLFEPLSAFGKPDCAGVVLTPACDLTQEKVEFVKFALAVRFQAYLEELLIPQRFKDTKEYNEEIAQDSKIFGQSYVRDPAKRINAITLRLVPELQRIFENVNPLKASHYYLPGKEIRTHGYWVDFSCIFSASYDQLKNSKPLLRLKSPWREQLLNRYVSYSLRIGTLDYSKSCISETIRAFFTELTTEQIAKKMK